VRSLDLLQVLDGAVVEEGAVGVLGLANGTVENFCQTNTEEQEQGGKRERKTDDRIGKANRTTQKKKATKRREERRQRGRDRGRERQTDFGDGPVAVFVDPLHALLVRRDVEGLLQQLHTGVVGVVLRNSERRGRRKGGDEKSK
jgi:hypothetical protein